MSHSLPLLIILLISLLPFFFFFFFFNDPATTEIYTLPLPDALPIFLLHRPQKDREPVVDDPPGDRLRHRQRGDDPPAVIDGARAEPDVRVISPRCGSPQIGRAHV